MWMFLSDNGISASRFITFITDTPPISQEQSCFRQYII